MSIESTINLDYYAIDLQRCTDGKKRFLYRKKNVLSYKINKNYILSIDITLFFFEKVVGSRFAWATRNVHITALNDSKYVGMSLYNVVLLSTTTAVVGYFLQDQHERSYILTSFFILLCVTITLCLVFVPKVREVLRDPYSRAKPQRAVVSSVTTKSTVDEYSEKRIWSNHPQQQLTLRLKQLTIQNATLRSNAIKVVIFRYIIFITNSFD